MVRVENAKRAALNPNSSAGSRVRVPRGTLCCCVPLCHSWKGKVSNGKPVTLRRLPLDLKLVHKASITLIIHGKRVAN